MAIPRNAFKRALKKAYDYLDLNLGAEGALPLPAISGGDAGKVVVVNVTEDDVEYVDDLVLDDLEVSGTLIVGAITDVEAAIDTAEAAIDAVEARLDLLEDYAERATDGAIATNGVAVLTKGSIGAYTLAAPGAADDGKQLIITSGTAFAHVVTATNLIHDGVTGGAKDTLTFAAFVGASAHLVAVNELWHVVALNLVTVAAV